MLLLTGYKRQKDGLTGGLWTMVEINEGIKGGRYLCMDG